MDSQDGFDSQDSQTSVFTVMDENTKEVMYFAYGSNLSTDQMLQRCPSSRPLGLGHLRGWRWIINERGYANIVREDDEGEGEKWGVYGLLYFLTEEDEKALDRFEGVPTAYVKETLGVRWVKGEGGREVSGADEEVAGVSALVYVNLTQVAEGPPKEEYVPRMERAIADAVANWGMSEQYADEVMRRFWR